MAEEMEQQETEESITLQLHHEGRQPSQQEASIESTGKHQISMRNLDTLFNSKYTSKTLLIENYTKNKQGRPKRNHNQICSTVHLCNTHAHILYNRDSPS